MVLDKFSNLSKIKKINSPILIISGKDYITLHSHSIKLYNEANNLKASLFIDEAMYNNLYGLKLIKKL